MDNEKYVSPSIYSSFTKDDDSRDNKTKKSKKSKKGFFRLNSNKPILLKPKLDKKYVGKNKYAKIKIAKPNKNPVKSFAKNTNKVIFNNTHGIRNIFSFMHAKANNRKMIMIVPEANGKTISMHITNIFIFFIFAVLAVIIYFGTVSYRKFEDERLILSNLNKYNKDLSLDMKKYSSAVSKLEEKILSYKDYFIKLSSMLSYNNYENILLDDYSDGDNILTISKELPYINKSLKDIESFYYARSYYQDMIPFGWPVANGGRITSGYGERSSPFTMKKSFHAGIDIAGPHATPILVVADGEVIFSGWRGGYGWFIIVKHKNGYETAYGHNSKNLVQVGEHVNEGQTIAEMGKTGRVTGTHCHFEVRINNKIVNPSKYIGVRF